MGGSCTCKEAPGPLPISPPISSNGTAAGVSSPTKVGSEALPEVLDSTKVWGPCLTTQTELTLFQNDLASG
ncbi:hypothetical protein LINPERHAP2_LOCUS11299 [Linum perenne]